MCSLKMSKFFCPASKQVPTSSSTSVRPFIVTQKEVNFKVKTLLEELESDTKATSEDPELMQHAAGKQHLAKNHGRWIAVFLDSKRFK